MITEKKNLPLGEYLALERDEILSPLNIWGTGEEIHRSPDVNDERDRNLLAEHWLKAGGLEHFREEHQIATTA